MTEIDSTSLPVLVAIVASIIQMIKQMPFIQKYKEYLPVLSMGLGVGLAYLQKLPDPFITGTVIGLTAAGAYDFLKEKTKKTPL